MMAYRTPVNTPEMKVRYSNPPTSVCDTNYITVCTLYFLVFKGFISVSPVLVSMPISKDASFNHISDNDECCALG